MKNFNPANSAFEHLGYFREYYIGSKFIGKISCEKDREVVGFHGRQTEILTEPVTLDNRKKIKAGVEVMTILYPLCGKLLNKS